MNQLTVRGFDRALARRIREVGKARGLSLNQAVVLLIRQGAGLAPAEPFRLPSGHAPAQEPRRARCVHRQPPCHGGPPLCQ